MKLNIRSYMLFLLCLTLNIQAQGTDPTPSPTRVINIQGKVYGGARQADVGGNTSVEIGSDHFDVIIDAVYGGNDVSGDIKGDNGANIHTYLSSTENKLFVGKLFGGGDGSYDYTSGLYQGLTVPELTKTNLQIEGGTFGLLFGGGNNATVTTSTTIHINNTSEVVKSIKDGGIELLDDARVKAMKLNLSQTHIQGEFQFGRVFGGNNIAPMAIRPKWDLKKGKIRDLYSGGNEGDMTSPDGLLLEINADKPDAKPSDPDVLWIADVYGGCRKADVRPEDADGNRVPTASIQLPEADNPGKIPPGFSARVRVLNGYVNNVYGGNDIAGTVYGGNTVGIFTTIHGNVYGGGNGSYAYTDKPNLKDDEIWGDFYYNPGSSSVDALNAHRPNAERVSIRISGTEAKRTIVEGDLYVGGNSATLEKKSADITKATAELKIGSYVRVDQVFLGNNGADMVDISEGGVLAKYAGSVTNDAGQEVEFSTLDLKDSETFKKYMEGCAMKIYPDVVFDNTVNSVENYTPYSTEIGSFYCGGNVGSMITEGKTTINFSDKVIIYNKVVGGCNSALVTPTDFNAIYEGGLLGSPDPAPAGSPNDAIGDKLELNFAGLKIQPKRWNADHSALIWNTISSSTGLDVDPVTEGEATTSSDDDKDRRFDGGNIYGGCYTSGIVNGNVVININSSIVDREILFDKVEEDETGEDKLYGNDQYHITKRNSGVILSEQGMDVLGKALNVFGGGKGVETEIWGSTTINLNLGYMFQIFGGSEEGAIGKGTHSETERSYTYDSRYSTYINLNGSVAGVSRKENMSENIAECEFIYGGGFLGPVAGNCIINLGNGRIFNSFAGACNADILGHTETHIGTNGFPYVRDYVYGGNDLGGQIKGTANFDSRLRNDGVRGKVYNNDMLNASAYIEYVQGHVEKIYGGAYGVYDYKDEHFRDYFDANGHAKSGYHKPFLDNAFINFRPIESNNALNTVRQIYGAGQGYLGEDQQDLMQNRSYILIDVPQAMTTFQGTEVFGAGESGGVGMGVAKATADNSETAHKASAIIDLLSGHFKAVYGGSYQEGVTRRTVVNVPEGSTFHAEAIFGGAYGLYNEYPCDVYESNVNWNSSDALVGGYRTGIYGGNNSYRRTLYSHVNINAPVYYDKDNKYYATVYGAGYGKDTWAQYTEVNLNNTARVYEAYGGGQLGRVMNKKSADAWAEPQAIDLSLGVGYTDTGLDNDLAIARNGKKYNTNVIIKQGADVCGYMYNGSLSGAYAYGGGLGDANTPNTGDVHGTTYIALLGGTVTKDIYAAGTVGSVNNKYNVDTDDFDKPFKASANAYIEGGTARNVYGGGWRGSVGYHTGAISDSPTGDVLGETHVVIGKKDGTSFIDGIPAIERNAYGGGEGGPVFGTANITLNKGFIGYRRFTSVPTTDTDLDYIQVGSDYYQEKLHDETWSGDGTNRLYDSGCIFGGGYIDNSSVDVTNVKMYGGVVRNALFGGGEIAAVGRGVINASGQDNSVRTLKGIYKAGKANVTLYEGEVHRNVFGGGRGYNNLGEGGTLYSDGYVFGQTEVHVHGGTVGTAKELARENGNVFGGGDIGYVYSAYEDDEGNLYVGIKDGDRYDDEWEGYYYAYKKGNEAYEPAPKPVTPPASDTHWVMDGTEYVLTEDCKVLIEPYCRAKSAVTINDHSYAEGDYVTTVDLHTLGNKNSDSHWNSLDDTGIVIFNAVFAGGNTSSGSSTVYANATTVFGNATASIHDVYHRDLITLGTGRTGGLYGDGNLTFVDGYRGLNITNYGTDYYNIAKEITIEQYHDLPDREAAYYQLKYKCIQECMDKDGTTYHKEGGEHSKASTLTIDDLLTLFEGNSTILLYNETTGEYYPNPDYWEENGVCSIYAGRLMNTLQRADFCGVFGSRMVMQGAEDRVPEIVDHTNYTINRVREVSLNHKTSVIESDKALKSGKTPALDIMDQNPEDFVNKDKAIHGNYFGIYSIVNYLGALTSDVFFLPGKNVRYTESASTDYKADSKAYDGGASKAYGKASYYDWKAGFVNERKRNNGTSLNKVALASGVYLELTTEKSTGDDLYQKDWGYITGVVELDLINVQPGMGGGFVYAKNVHKVGSYEFHKHNTLTALNDDAVTRRDFTYTGSEVEWETSGNFIHSTQTIIDDCYNVSGKYKEGDAVPAHYWFIKGSVYVYDQYISAYTGAPNAYSETVDIPLTITAASHGTMKLLNVMPNKYAYYSAPGTKIGADKKIVINDVEYHLNDPINYWDWYLLTSSEKNLFVDETYVTTADCKYSSSDANVIPAGTVMLPAEYNTLKAAHPKVYHVEKQDDVDFDFVYRSSNNMSHDTGYLLTYRVNNPTDWNTWYTKADGSEAKNQTGGTGFEDGPTYHLKDSSKDGGVLGQREYQVSNLISKDIYTTYQTMKTNHSSAIPGGQADFEGAYIVTNEYTNGNVHLNVGSTVSATQAASMDGYVAPAFICTSTIQLSKTEFIYVGNRMTQAEKDAYKVSHPALATIIESDIVPAYYCTKDGLYGGNYYEAGKNYRGLEVWSSMSKTDREKFEFNYDALDVLIDPLYSKNASGGYIYSEGKKYQYDSAAGTKEAAEANLAGYSLERPVNYSATYNGSDDSEHNGIKLENGKEYSRVEYEKLPNEKRHYTPIEVKAAGEVYVVNSAFQVGNSPYAVGTIISASTYGSLANSDKANITTLQFTSDHVGKTYYYCREAYKVGENTEGESVTGVTGINAAEAGTYNENGNVPVGLVIEESNYNSLANWQTNFSIHGIAPTETSTLYVSRFSDIFDLSKEKIITVIYEYNYEETDASGTHVTPVSERHVVNIHVVFKSGVPFVEDIKAPQIVLPGTFVGVREPHVTPGAYEVTGGGWKLFEKKSDAESHINGIEYTPTADPLYWYQHGYYLAYYAKTYLGETYSNTVQVSVANYHDLKKVLDDTNHYYVDNPTVKRNSKIYINDATNGAAQLKRFYDLSKSTLNEHVRDCQNLEFILRTNINHTDGWTSIGEENHCFSGNFHGDGYHIDGLNKSLFGHLCGNVYNLGVTGSFTSAGIADTGDGYVENCWINTTGTPASDVKAVFGEPTASGYKRVNCYYPETLKYDKEDDGHGLARPMPETAFYNGTVAYDLNGFYLFKRYNDKKTTSGKAYQYYAINKTDGKLTEPQTKYYAHNIQYCSSGLEGIYDEKGGYVEDRFGDGDFRYADGVIPETEDQRTLVDADGNSHFYPIWPDDYLYFGQMLTYGWNESRPHEDVPSHIVKNNGRLPNTNESNRVYRAPAYYQSKVMDVAHFNPSVNLVDYSKPKNDNDTNLKPAYPNMTAIDFAGHNDKEYKQGFNGKFFYQPLLDDDGLVNINATVQTKNLLVYAPSSENNQNTYTVLNNYFGAKEPEFEFNSNSIFTSDQTPENYKRVAVVQTDKIIGIVGHLVQSNLITTSDHLLVDKQDFNCPIAYKMGEGKRMWYQRTPDKFVKFVKKESDQSKEWEGWEDVCLPFSIDLVTTQSKGEITHFYQNSTKGHEYWLRELTNIQNPSDNTDALGIFKYPQAGTEGKHYTNTFLYDYYYSRNSFDDANQDDYQQNYYSAPHTYNNYPRSVADKPYLIGFPSAYYFEFDLCGEWTPSNTASQAPAILPPAKLPKQTITFASKASTNSNYAEIGVSDDQMKQEEYNGYLYCTNYLNKELEAGSYLLSAKGDKYEKLEAKKAVLPFRPYFMKKPSSTRGGARGIIFSDENGNMNTTPIKQVVTNADDLIVKGGKKKIIVESELHYTTDVRIVTPSGITLTTYAIEPGETIETRVETAGVYIVYGDNGKYVKKVIVK